MVKDVKLSDLSDAERAAVEWAVESYVKLQEYAPTAFFDEQPLTADEIRSSGLRIVLRQLDQYVKLYKEHLAEQFLDNKSLNSNPRKREL